MADPEVLYVDAHEGEPMQFESLCMECMENVRASPPLSLVLTLLQGDRFRKKGSILFLIYYRVQLQWSSPRFPTFEKSWCTPSSASTVATGKKPDHHIMPLIYHQKFSIAETDMHAAPD